MAIEMMRVNIPHSRKSEKGISLLEIAIALIVIGLLVGPLLELYKYERIKLVKDANINLVEKISKSLTQFAQQNERLPFPASPILSDIATNAGLENATLVTTPCSAVTGVRCVAGRDANGDGAPDDVLVGSVPFKVLNLNSQEALDVYNMKITYAVSRFLTNPATFKDSNGAISVLNQSTPNQPINVTGPGSPTYGNILYVLISHGADRKGAYYPDGTLSNCTDPGLDDENCDMAGMNSTFRGMQKLASTGGLGIGRVDDTQLADGVEHFDDIMRLSLTTADELWAVQRTAAGQENLMKSAQKKVGINISDDTIPSHMLQVNGNIKAQQTLLGRVADAAGPDIPGTICDISNYFCFRIANIVAPSTDPNAIYCNVQKPLTKINDGPNYPPQIARSNCDPDPKSLVTGSFSPCASGNGYNGLDASGNPTCAP